MLSSIIPPQRFACVEMSIKLWLLATKISIMQLIHCIFMGNGRTWWQEWGESPVSGSSYWSYT